LTQLKVNKVISRKDYTPLPELVEGNFAVVFGLRQAQAAIPGTFISGNRLTPVPLANTKQYPLNIFKKRNNTYEKRTKTSKTPNGNHDENGQQSWPTTTTLFWWFYL
jgi:hypothetical protein